MVYAALIFSICSFILSVAIVIFFRAFRREMRRPHTFSPWSDELLTRDAWLEEIEARGEAVLARIEEAEKRINAAQYHVVDAPPSRHRVSPPIQPAAVDTLPDAVGTTVDAPLEKTAESSPAKSLASRDAAMESAASRSKQPDVRTQVRLLAEQGLDVTTIAQRLQLGRGEVELFLGLSSGGRDAK